MELLIDKKLNLTPKKFNKSFSQSKWFTSKLIKNITFDLNIYNKTDFDNVHNDYLEKPVVIKENGDTFNAYVSNVFMKHQQFHGNHFAQAIFSITVSELDPKPQFDKAEINGCKFKVIEYKINNSDDSDNHQFLLKLNEEEFNCINNIIANFKDNIEFKRIGVDSDRISARLGGRNVWSKHQDENGNTFFKQIIRCVCIKSENLLSANLACGIRQSNLVLAVAGLKNKLSFIIKKMESKNILTQEDIDILSDESKLNEIVPDSADFWVNLDIVSDAEFFF